jgi:hypothetical protein
MKSFFKRKPNDFNSQTTLDALQRIMSITPPPQAVVRNPRGNSSTLNNNSPRLSLGNSPIELSENPDHEEFGLVSRSKSMNGTSRPILQENLDSPLVLASATGFMGNSRRGFGCCGSGNESPSRNSGNDVSALDETEYKDDYIRCDSSYLDHRDSIDRETIAEVASLSKELVDNLMRPYQYNKLPNISGAMNSSYAEVSKYGTDVDGNIKDEK